MRKLAFGTVLVMLFLTLLVIPESSASGEGGYDEYWCYGDRLSLQFGGDLAIVTWVITDENGMVLFQDEAENVDFIASGYDLLYVTQTVENEYGSVVKTIIIHMIHLNSSSIEVLFTLEPNGAPYSTKIIDGNTVCRNGLFVELPDSPTPPKDSMIFNGWHIYKNGVEIEYDPNELILENLNIFATWLNLYNVKFISEGATYLSLTCIEGETVDAPPLESKPGRTFEGWYIDPNCTVPYDPVAGITQDQAVYAKWSEPKDTKELLAPFLLVPFGIAAAVIGLRHIRVQKTVVRKNRRYR